MEKSISTYIKWAVSILTPNISLLYSLIILGLGVCVPQLIAQTYWPVIYIVSLSLIFIVCPLIYGRFIEIITGQEHISWANIYREHWINFIVVQILVFVIFLPTFLILRLFNVPPTSTSGIFALIVDICGIYIFPLVFFTQNRMKSIRLGLQCLIGNLQFTIPLIILMTLPFILVSLIPETSNPAYALLFFAVYSFSIIIDFTVFIAAGLILKDKLGF